MIRNITLTLLFALALCNSVHAQEKANVVVEKFTSKGSFSEDEINSLRRKVILSLASTERVNVVSEEEVTSEDNNVFFIKGLLYAPSIQSSKVKDKGQTLNLTEAEINYIITAYDPSTQKHLSSYRFSSRGISEQGQSDAISSALDLARPKMKNFVEDAFPVVGKIIQVDETKKNEAVSVFISLGSNDGIKKKQKFAVNVVKYIAGEAFAKEIGTLTATEVGETKTLCTVNKGGEAILSNLNSQTEMTINTRAKRSLFKDFNSVAGVVTESGTAVSSPYKTFARKTPTQPTPSVTTSDNVIQEQTVGNAQYYGFLDNKCLIPLTDWNSSQAAIENYMKDHGYKRGDMLDYSKDIDRDTTHGIVYMIINGRFFQVSSVFTHIKKEDALSWLKSYYIYKSSNNEGFMDSHEFLTKDKKTKVTVNFTNINGAEHSMMTMIYSKTNM